MRRKMYRKGAQREQGQKERPQEIPESRRFLRMHWFRYFLVLAAFATLCYGCGVAAMSTMKNFSLSEEISLDNSTDNVMPIVEEVGKSLGYRVNMRMKHGDFTSLSFERDSSFLATMAVGYMRNATLLVSHDPKGQKLQLTLTVGGTLGAGKEADAQKALEDFKDKLQEKLSTCEQTEKDVLPTVTQTKTRQ